MQSWCARSAAARAVFFALVLTPIAVQLVILHAPEGHEITIAPHQVTSLRASIPNKPNELLTGKVNCVVGLTDGKFVSVIESCAVIRRLLEGK